MTINGYSNIAEKSASSISSYANAAKGASVVNNIPQSKVVTARKVEYLMNDSKDVVHVLEQNNAEVEAHSRDVQRISADVVGRKTQFTVLKGVGLVVEIVDPLTDKVIKEIPSRESLLLREQMEKTAGLIFNKTV